MSNYKIIYNLKKVVSKNNTKEIIYTENDEVIMCEIENQDMTIKELKDILRVVLGYDYLKDKLLINSHDKYRFIAIISEDENELPDISGEHLSYYHCMITES